VIELLGSDLKEEGRTYLEKRLCLVQINC
jgi:hypothetical protein